MDRPTSETYYYIWGKTYSGRNYIDGSYASEEEAWQNAYSVTDIDQSKTKIIPLRTISLSAATRAIKKLDLDETRSIDESLSNARHRLQE